MVGDRLAVDPEQLDPAEAAVLHEADERVGPTVGGRAERQHAPRPALEVRDRRPVDEHDERPCGACRASGRGRPRDGGAVRLGRIGCGQRHDLWAFLSVPIPPHLTSAEERRRSTAPGIANCAAPSPATKYPRRTLPASSIAFSTG